MTLEFKLGKQDSYRAFEDVADVPNNATSIFRRKTLQQALQESETKTDLHRCLSVWELIAVGVGGTIGAGIFIICGVAYGSIAGPSFILSFAIAGVASIFASLCYAEFSARLPLSGSAYLYAYTSVGEVFALIIGSNLYIEYAISSALVVRGWIGYLDSLTFNSLPPIITGLSVGDGVFSISILAPFVVALMCFVIGRGAKESGMFTGIMTALKVIIVLFVVFAGIGYFEPKNLSPFFPFGVSSMFRGAGTVFFAYVGFDAIAATAEEAKNPQRDLPIAIVGSLLICTTLYIAVCAILAGMVPPSLVVIDSPLSDAFATRGMPWAKIVVNVGAFIGLITTAFVGFIPQPRILYSMARDGLIYKPFGKIHPKFRTPLNGTVLSAVIAGVLSCLFSLQELSDLVSIGVLLSYTIVSASVIILRYRSPQKPHTALGLTVSVMVLVGAASTISLFSSDIIAPAVVFALAVIPAAMLFFQKPYNVPSTFKCPWVPLLPLLSVAVNVHLMVSLTTITWARLFVWTALSLIVYFTYGKKNSVVASYKPLASVAGSVDAF